MPASKNPELSKKYGGGYGWLVAHKDYAGEGCLIWPLGCDQEGRGQVCVGNGKVRKAHRVMCELVNGPCPPGHQAAHECGNGHLGCVHPKHLKWKTQSANTYDRVRHGRHTGNPAGRTTLFSAEQIESLRADILAGEMTVIGMSRKYEVARSVIQFWRKKFAADPNVAVPQARGTYLLPNGKWQARITIGFKSHVLGYFETEEEAHQAFLAARDSKAA